MDKLDEFLMNFILEAFHRRVEPTWINPSKSTWIKEEHGFSFQDNSPEGIYPAMIVPRQHYDEVLVIMPQDKFKELLELWKKANPKIVRAAYRIIEKEQQEKALENLRRLF